MKKVIIIGAGGHGKVVAGIIKRSKDRLIGFLDSNRNDGYCVGVPIIGYDYEYRKYKDCWFVIAVGDSKARAAIARKMKDVKWYTVISPNAVISSLDVTIGKGSVIGDRVVINPNTAIGRHCIINTGSIVEHDNNVGDFCHVSVGANLAGKVTIGKHTWIGVGATVSDHVSIVGNCMIGAGAVVVSDISEVGTYIGCPAKKFVKRT